MESPKILQEEIKALEQMLNEKKKEFAESGTEFKPESAAKEVVKEYASAAAPAPASVQAPAGDADALKKIADSFQNEPHAKQIDELMNIAGKHGISNAVEVAKHLKNPHLLDDFHDRLVFELLSNKQ